VTYTVTAADASTANYVVTVTVAAAKSSDKAITAFSFLATDNPGKLGADAVAAIDDTAKHIHASLPAGTSVLSLKPSIVVSPGATVSPASLADADFSSALIYTVTAADGSTQDYSVCVLNQPTAPEMLWNRDFSYVFSYGSATHASAWYEWQNSGAASAIDFSSKAFVLSGSPRGSGNSSICLGQILDLAQYGIYQLAFEASSTNPGDVITAMIQENGEDIDGDGNAWTIWNSAEFSLNSTARSYSAPLAMWQYDNPKAYFIIAFGKRTSGTITIDNVSLKADGNFTPIDGELVWNGDFSLGQSYWNSWVNTANGANPKMEFTDGAFTLSGSARGTHDYDVQLWSGQKALSKGTTYQISFDASSTVSGDVIRATLSENGVDANGDGKTKSDWVDHSGISLSTTMTPYSFIMIMPSDYDDPNGRLLLQLGATTGTITIDNVSMEPVT
jgi:hypothetical protein